MRLELGGLHRVGEPAPTEAGFEDHRCTLGPGAQLALQPRTIRVFEALSPEEPILGIACRRARELLVEIAPNV